MNKVVKVFLENGQILSFETAFEEHAHWLQMILMMSNVITKDISSVSIEDGV